MTDNNEHNLNDNNNQEDSSENNIEENSSKNNWLPDIRKYWIPAIITGVLGGLIIAFAVPWSNSIFERQRVFQERKTRLLESTAEIIAGVVAHTGKIRALEKAILEEKKNLDSSKPNSEKKRIELEEYVNKRGRELRETEVALYSLYQKLRANFDLIEVFYEEQARIAIENFFEWYEAQGDKPIQAKDLSFHSRKIIKAMVKEMGK